MTRAHFVNGTACLRAVFARSSSSCPASDVHAPDRAACGQRSCQDIYPLQPLIVLFMLDDACNQYHRHSPVTKPAPVIIDFWITDQAGSRPTLHERRALIVHLTRRDRLLLLVSVLGNCAAPVSGKSSIVRTTRRTVHDC